MLFKVFYDTVNIANVFTPLVAQEEIWKENREGWLTN